MVTRKGVIVKVQQWMEKVFGGSDDVEAEDAVDVVDHFTISARTQSPLRT